MKFDLKLSSRMSENSDWSLISHLKYFYSEYIFHQKILTKLLQSKQIVA